MDLGTATSAQPQWLRPPVPYRTFAALFSAGFRRYSTYRQATAAAAFTNTVFGFLNCYVLLAVAAGNGGTAAGYRPAQLATFVWVSQGLLGTVGLWGDSQLADRIRTGDVVADLLRPIHPVVTYLANDLGRAAFALLTRFVVPLAVGALAFHLYAPHRLVTYPLFAVALVLATLVSFGCRYLVNAASFWLLDSRGAQRAWNLASGLLGGLYFPLRFLPGPVAAGLWLGTPFPSLLQTPQDIIVERTSTWVALGLVLVQAAWAVVLFWLCRVVQRAAERRLVVQGG